jgi:hypothetical protein
MNAAVFFQRIVEEMESEAVEEEKAKKKLETGNKQ